MSVLLPLGPAFQFQHLIRTQSVLYLVQRCDDRTRRPFISKAFYDDIK